MLENLKFRFDKVQPIPPSGFDNHFQFFFSHSANKRTPHPPRTHTQAHTNSTQIPHFERPSPLGKMNGLEHPDIGSFRDKSGRKYDVVWDGDYYERHRSLGLLTAQSQKIYKVLQGGAMNRARKKDMGSLILNVFDKKGILPSPAMDNSVLNLTHCRTLTPVKVVYRSLMQKTLKSKSGLIFASSFIVNA